VFFWCFFGRIREILSRAPKSGPRFFQELAIFVPSRKPLRHRFGLWKFQRLPETLVGPCDLINTTIEYIPKALTECFFHNIAWFGNNDVETHDRRQGDAGSKAAHLGLV
jgi:hypothetical protein